MRITDLVHITKENIPVYPGTKTSTLTLVSVYEKDGFRENLLRTIMHTDMHMNPPTYLFPGRTILDEFPAPQFIGEAPVIDCSSLKGEEEVTPAHITRYEEEAEKADFLPSYLGWDRHWGGECYFGDYPCLGEKAFDFVIRGTCRGIDFDMIGLDPTTDVGLSRHKKLFRGRDIVNVENPENLELCGEEPLSFNCFPLKLEHGNGSPMRAVAWFEKEA